MRKLDVEARLECARAGVTIIRALQLHGKKIPYAQFAKEIGLLPDGEKWGAWYKSRVGEILDLIVVADKTANPPKPERIRCDCVIDAKTGQPGAGLHKSVRIARTPHKISN